MKKKQVLAVVIAAMILGGCGHENIETPTTENTAIMQEETADETNTGLETAADAETIEEASRDVFAMDTYMSVTAYGTDAENVNAAADAAIAEIERLDSLLSTGDADSEIAKINENGSGSLSSDTAYLVERSLALCEETDGAFDLAIYPVMKAWGFTDENYQVPSSETLEALMALADPSLICFDSEQSTISFEKEGVQIDLGAIAKGYTSSRIMDIYREYGIESGLVNLGGNVQVMGTKPDGSLWRIAIQSPDDSEGYLGVLSTQDRAVITSGGYERYFEQDGKIYHHIIDPKTGYPAENGLVSVTIVSPDGTLADGLSTSLFVMGKEKAVDYWRSHSDMFEMILLDDDGSLYVSEGLYASFTSDMEIQIIEKDGE